MPSDRNMDMPDKELRTWEAMQTRLPGLLIDLKTSPALVRGHRDRLPPIPERGIYVFYDNGEPRYVGRSNRIRSRIMEHGRRSSGHTSATFAFLLAVEAAENRGIDCTNQTRAVLQKSAAFKPIYDAKKEEVRQMPVRVVEITDAIEQSIFEIYAALHLPTVRPYGYNDFETH